MSEILDLLTSCIRTEMDKPEWKQQIFEPINRWMFAKIWPYAIALICANFFMTIAAVSLVLYFTTKPNIKYDVKFERSI